MTCPELIVLVRNLILSGAAITGALVAIKGLNTWKQQLKGRSEYDLSRRILVSLFKFRDAIYAVRNPAIWSNEVPAPPAEKAKNMSEREVYFYGTSEVYQARWDKVRNERTTLYADLLEAEALWGNDLKKLFKAVFDLEQELRRGIRDFLTLRDPDGDEDMKKVIRKDTKATRNVMYAIGDEGDKYKNDFEAAVKNIEKYLKSKLTH